MIEAPQVRAEKTRFKALYPHFLDSHGNAKVCAVTGF